MSNDNDIGAPRTRAALYARVSTGAQTTENQRRALRAWADRLGVAVVGEYVDQASGGRADRAGLRALLDAAHRREFDGVLASREGIGAMAAYLLARLRASARAGGDCARPLLNCRRSPRRSRPGCRRET